MQETWVGSWGRSPGDRNGNPLQYACLENPIEEPDGLDLLIAFELFGFAGMPYFLVTVAVSYMLSGYESLYHKQRIVYSKLHTNFTAKH